MKKREILLIVLLVGFDQLTKYIVEATMRLYQSIEVIEGFFSITFVTNTGAGWSILEGQMVFFYIMTVIASATMIYYIVKSDKNNKLFRLAFCLMLAGALGNFIDRLMFQHVRDFLDFIIFNYDFPVFNIADTQLSIGFALLVLETFLNRNNDNAEI